MASTPETIRLWGETLCLDYANSVDWSPEDQNVERAKPVKWVKTTEQTDVLRSGDMLTRWGRRLGLLSDEARPASAAELRHARALRDAVYHVFASISRAEEPARNDVDVLMSNYVEGVKHASLRPGDGSYQLEWSARDPRSIRYAVAADAITLLQDSDRLERVSRCPGRGCGWLFLNLSGRRRWCSMSTCGSREKMRRLYQRRTQHAD